MIPKVEGKIFKIEEFSTTVLVSFMSNLTSGKTDDWHRQDIVLPKEAYNEHPLHVGERVFMTLQVYQK